MIGKRRRRRLLRAWRARRTLPMRAQAPRRAPEEDATAPRGAPRPAPGAWLLRQLRRPTQAIALAAAVAIAALGAHAATSARYRLAGAVVSGNERSSDAAIYAASELDGRALFTVRRRAAERRIVEALPEVKAARVSLGLPARLSIEVEETEPVLLWRSGASLLIVDERGLAIAPPADTERSAGLPAVTDLSDRPLGLGERLPATTLGAALAYSEAFGELVYRAPEGFVARGPEGWEVRLGQEAARLAEQRLLLASLERELGPEAGGVALVDLRYPSRPYYRFEDAWEAAP